MKRLFLLLSVLSFSIIVFAQKNNPAVKSFVTQKGKFTIYHYSENIYKIKFEPQGYTRGEYISDAVILKTPVTISYPFEAKLNGDTVFIKEKPIIIGTHRTDGYRGFYFPLKDNEMIFGSGERALPLNRRGYRLNLYNNPWYGYGEGADNLNYTVPFISSSEGYGLFFDNPSKSYLDIGKANKNILEYGAFSDELNVYVIFGNYEQVLQSYYKLTGTQPLPPRWAFGNLMSRFGYTSEEQVKAIYSKMKKENIPVDAVIFDLFWFGDSIKYTLGNLDWINQKAWPDPKGMINDFKNDGVKTILVTEPFFVESSKNYKASKPYLAVDSTGKPYYLTDFYFGHGGLVDIFRKDAQDWFWKFYKKQMDIGVEAWWGDLGEPEKHPADLYHNLNDYGYKRLFSADEVHNMYGHTWTKMLYTEFAKDFPNKRLFSLNRSGFAGSQHYSIFPWTGDVSRNWSGFRAQLPILLGMSMSGVPYVHSDAGGFAGGEGDNELYVRWLQFATFTPIFRPHGTALYEKDPSAFSFPSEAALIDTPYRDMAKNAINMRYAFLPYNYSLAYEQAKYGKPLMAPLYYYFPNDTAAVKIQDEYMWGENVLVAPVVEKGAGIRTYYLPEGNWYEVKKQGKFIGGNSWHTDSINLSRFPFFYKEGAFIILNAKKNANAENYHADSLSIVYVLSGDSSSYELYNDDGQTKNAIEKKQYELIKFSSSGLRDDSLVLNIQSNKGNYSGKKKNKSMLFKILQQKGKPSMVLMDGKKLSESSASLEKKNQYKYAEDGTIYFNIGFTESPVTIKIIWQY